MRLRSQRRPREKICSLIQKIRDWTCRDAEPWTSAGDLCAQHLSVRSGKTWKSGWQTNTVHFHLKHSGFYFVIISSRCMLLFLILISSVSACASSCWGKGSGSGAKRIGGGKSSS